MPFETDIYESDLAQALKQSITVRRADKKMDGMLLEYDPTDTDTFTELATNVDAIIEPVEQLQQIREGGQVIEQFDFNCYLFTPIENIKDGDIIVAAKHPKLFVANVYNPDNTNVMILDLTSPQT